jgi:glyoxylase-like metal-dependent hydrolase (beta-lactamase superfamily II)
MRVYPLLLGELMSHEGDLYRGGDSRIQSAFSCFAFFIEGASRRILVDTGFGDPAEVKRYMSTAEGFILKCDAGMSLPEQLERIGSKPEDVEAAVLTHCHWDHIGGLGLLPNAIVYCPRDEISWAVFPQPWMRRSYLPERGRSLVDVGARMIPLDGDTVIEKGIRTRLVGGHSPGSQIVEVETSRGTVIITGDLIMKYSNIERMHPIGSFHNIETADRFLTSMRNRILEDPRTIVLPGHDPLVWERYQEGI